MPAKRTCTECGASLAKLGPQAKTCTAECRQKRSRRQRKARVERNDLKNYPPLIAQVAAQVDTQQGTEVVHKLVEQELRPIIREAITEQTLQGIQDMLKLVPEMVKALADDLDSDDASIRQRAYTLGIKYTMGHPALIRPVDEMANAQMNVHFNLPRPDYVPVDEVTGDEVESRTCNMCEAIKPADQFIANSNRCVDCQAEWSERINAMVE